MYTEAEATFFTSIIENWIASLGTNTWLIGKQIEGLSHADTMLQLPFRGNRLNWVLGHIVEHRDWMLKALDAVPLLSEDMTALYRRGSEALTDDSPVLTLDELMELLRTGQAQLAEIVQNATPEFLQDIPGRNILPESHHDKTRLQRLQGLLWHETYHAGQLEILRQLAGVDDAVL